GSPRGHGQAGRRPTHTNDQPFTRAGRGSPAHPDPAKLLPANHCRPRGTGTASCRSALQPLPIAGAGAQSPEVAITGLPAKLHVLSTEWSPDGQHIALVNADTGAKTGPGTPESVGLSLWIVDVARASAALVPGVRLNSVLANPISWLNNRSLAVLTAPSNRGSLPVRSEIPTGPVVQENEGRATPAPTYEDLLKTPIDERIFEFYATSQIAGVMISGGAARKLGK